MHQNSSSFIETLLNKAVTCREVLDYVFIFDVIDLDHVMGVVGEEGGVEWEA